MDFLKSLLDNDMPTVPSLSRLKEPEGLPLVIGLDHCNRFRPLFDKKTFQKEVENTEGELMEYVEPGISNQYRRFVKTSEYLVYGIWGVGMGFAVYCHKLAFLRRLLGEKSIKMLSFKITSLAAPYLFMEKVMPQAE